jgi:SAM-dependent methyltransferase
MEKKMGWSWISGGLFILTRWFPRLRPAGWGYLYNWLAKKDETGQLIFMNYGYLEGDDLLPLQPEDEAFRSSIQLYQRVVRGIDIKNKNLLEVGSGRGGGGDFYLRYHSPCFYTGVDLSKKAIERCVQRFKYSNAKWLRGSADALPVASGEFDIVINVESSHSYPSISNFLSEVYRALRPGGCFAYCDLLVDEGIGSMKEFESASRAAGLLLIEKEIITAGVLRALDRITQLREKQIKDEVPRLFHPILRDFSGVKNSLVYNLLKQGKIKYICYMMRKPKI